MRHKKKSIEKIFNDGGDRNFWLFQFFFRKFTLFAFLDAQTNISSLIRDLQKNILPKSRMEFNFTHFCSPTELPESKNDKDMHTYCVWWVVWWWNWLEFGRKGNKSFKKNISKTVWSQILVSWFSAVITNRASILKIKFICVKNMFIIFLQFNCDMLHTINLYTKLVNLKLNTFCFKTLCRK